MKNIQKGFTLIELMIVVAIVGIVAAVALPAYQNYTAKAKFSEVIAAVTPIKQAIQICYVEQGGANLASCDTEAEVGALLLAAAIGTYVSAVTITENTGVITATSTGVDSSNSTYILTPTVNDTYNTITWAESGTCVANGVC